MIKLRDGSSVPIDSIQFNAQTYHFTATGRGDITDLIYRADKLSLVPDFDVTRENFRLSSERGNTPGMGLDPLETDTGAILLDQITTDPLGAPLESLNNVVNKILSAPGVVKVAILGAVLLVAYVYVKKS